MKTQMQLANRAWRVETKAIGWDKGWKKGRKGWRTFCRENAEVTAQESHEHFDSQEAANDAVREEISEWTP